MPKAKKYYWSFVNTIAELILRSHCCLVQQIGELGSWLMGVLLAPERLKSRKLENNSTEIFCIQFDSDVFRRVDREESPRLTFVGLRSRVKSKQKPQIHRNIQLKCIYRVCLVS